MHVNSISGKRFGLVCHRAALALVTFLVGPAHTNAQVEDDEFRAGLIAEYRGDGDTRFTRVDPVVSFNWDGAVPDERLSGSKFSVVWRGLLMSQSTGSYQLFAHTAGEVTIKLNGKVVLSGQSAQPQWIESPQIELSFAWHPIEISYQKTGEKGQLSLFWSGPKFQLEPISNRQLFHDPAKTPSDSFERGAMLARALRCSACHANDVTSPPILAPDLSRLSGNVNESWIVEWLARHDRETEDRGDLLRRMPTFDFSAADAKAIAAYLMSESRPAPSRKIGKGDLAKGERLFLSLGCLACHRIGELGESGLFGGGDLSQIAQKHPADFFGAWLADPAKINSRHRMPVFALSSQERGDLAKYLSSLNATAVQPDDARASVDKDTVQRGKALFLANRCANCHGIREKPAEDLANVKRLDKESEWTGACTATSDRTKNRPGYQLTDRDRMALQSYFSSMQISSDKQRIDGASLVVENNCLACHARNQSNGIADQLTELSKAHRELATEIPGMIPPSLNSIGDKLRDAALVEVIQRKNPTRRPWLHVRMPKFNLSDEELKAVAERFVQTDRIPDRPKSNSAALSESALRVAGAQLLTTGGFGCTSCHQVGKSIPPKAPLNARGPDLSMLGQRIRREWYDRFVPNPARIVPHMEMPSIQLAVRGVLDEKIDDQLAATWYVLNQPDFQPPRPDAVRIVSRSGQADQHERAAVLTDVLRAPDETFVKPLLIGLPNRHNVLFDFATGRLTDWRIGDVAHQQTEGKTWFWEPGGVRVQRLLVDQAELELQHDGRTYMPQPFGQFIAQFDEWSHTRAGGVRLVYRLRCESSSSKDQMVFAVEQELNPQCATGDRPTGFVRDVKVTQVPSGAQVRLRVIAASDLKDAKYSADRRELQLPGASRTRFRVIAPDDAMFDLHGSLVASASNESVAFRLEYLSDLPVGPSLVKAVEFPAPEAVTLNVVPGFEAIQLPLADEVMPTGLAWQPDGTLIVASLKGRVWLARDTNGDGLEDSLQSYADELAAPYGVAGNGSHIDVVNKYALLRLFDDDRDGRADRTVAVASGWGHTTDYHDWVVGLPRDEDGCYYVGIPCQQDERSAEAARYRGTVLKLVPRTPTDDDPRAYEIKQISGGHRFPMGIARSRLGEMFVTDNQGNYNPFNELNHVMQDARYGFINAIERSKDFNPPLTPPAIDIPHPWTRSVNGICFLDTPPQINQRRETFFGPFEGHLIGCEYDTRRLVRMSLEKVGDTYQGAAYPFSYDTPPDGPPLLGPLVCAVAPEGSIYVGNIRDSGWGGSNNIGSIVRLRPQLDKLPAGIAEVRARRDGFTIHFTKPVDRARAADASNYLLSSYTRDSTPAYGGADRDRRTEKIARVDLAEDRSSVTLQLNEMRQGFVYEIRLKDLTGGEPFFPAEAYYTLRSAPKH